MALALQRLVHRRRSPHRAEHRGITAQLRRQLREVLAKIVQRGAPVELDVLVLVAPQGCRHSLRNGLWPQAGGLIRAEAQQARQRVSSVSHSLRVGALMRYSCDTGFSEAGLNIKFSVFSSNHFDLRTTLTLRSLVALDVNVKVIFQRGPAWRVIVRHGGHTQRSEGSVGSGVSSKLVWPKNKSRPNGKNTNHCRMLDYLGMLSLAIGNLHFDQLSCSGICCCHSQNTPAMPMSHMKPWANVSHVGIFVGMGSWQQHQQNQKIQWTRLHFVFFQKTMCLTIKCMTLQVAQLAFMFGHEPKPSKGNISEYVNHGQQFHCILTSVSAASNMQGKFEYARASFGKYGHTFAIIVGSYVYCGPNMACMKDQKAITITTCAWRRFCFCSWFVPPSQAARVTCIHGVCTILLVSLLGPAHWTSNQIENRGSIFFVQIDSKSWLWVWSDKEKKQRARVRRHGMTLARLIDGVAFTNVVQSYVCVHP